jgi:hypothetical protein
MTPLRARARRSQRQGRLLRLVRRSACAFVGGMLVTGAAATWAAVPAASDDSTTQAQSSTSLSYVATGPTSTTFRAKVTGAPAGAPTPTGSVTFSVNGSDTLDCDGLPSDSVPMTGGVATCRVTPALPPSGSPATAQADYSGDNNFAASDGTLTVSDGNFAPPVPLVVMPPASIPDDCSSDAEPALASWLSSLPPGTASQPLVIKFAPTACYAVDEPLDLQGLTNTVFNGQGATIEEPSPPANQQPIVNLWVDTNLTMEDLTIEGAYNGSNGGVGLEGDYGLVLEGDSGIYLTHMNVTDVQGDFIYLSPPYDVSSLTDALNTDVDVTNSVFKNAGYHGISVESANGLTFKDDIFDNMGTDAMDFEYDDYSTAFNPDGTPYWAAQDNVTIADNAWINWSGDWFVSDQGQTPGVQQQNVTITGNTLVADAPVFEIVGTFWPFTSAPYLNDYLTITNNSFSPGYYAEPYRGGTSVAMSIHDVSNLLMQGNNFPVCAWTYEVPQPASQCAAPDEYEMDLYGIVGGKILDNDFADSLGIVEPRDYPTARTGMALCGNTYGTGVLDDACTAGTG